MRSRTTLRILTLTSIAASTDFCELLIFCTFVCKHEMKSGSRRKRTKKREESKREKSFASRNIIWIIYYMCAASKIYAGSTPIFSIRIFIFLFLLLPLSENIHMYEGFWLRRNHEHRLFLKILIPFRNCTKDVHYHI